MRSGQSPGQPSIWRGSSDTLGTMTTITSYFQGDRTTRYVPATMELPALRETCLLKVLSDFQALCTWSLAKPF
jgi:hypothetical protein